MSYRTAELRGIIARARPDGSLFDAALRGDPVAFAEIYRRYHGRVYAYCLSRVMDQQLAEDACQETFVRFLHADPSSVPNPRAWLFTVARNVSVDLVRQRSHFDSNSDIGDRSEAIVGVAADSGEELMAREKGRTIMLAIRRLRPRYRSALILRELHGLSSVEIGEALGMTPGAVDTLVSRARDAFGTAYAEVSDLPSGCAEAFPLIYKRFGSGLDEAERARLDAHVAVCDRCAAEVRRADKPDRLSAALPFLLPLGAKGVPGGFARMLAAVDPSLAAAPVSAAPAMPVVEHVVPKVAAVALAITVAAAPIGGAVVRSERVRPVRPVAATSAAHAGGGATSRTPGRGPGVSAPAGDPAVAGGVGRNATRAARGSADASSGVAASAAGGATKPKAGSRKGGATAGGAGAGAKKGSDAGGGAGTKAGSGTKKGTGAKKRSGTKTRTGTKKGTRSKKRATTRKRTSDATGSSAKSREQRRATALDAGAGTQRAPRTPAPSEAPLTDAVSGTDAAAATE